MLYYFLIAYSVGWQFYPTPLSDLLLKKAAEMQAETRS